MGMFTTLREAVSGRRVVPPAPNGRTPLPDTSDDEWIGFVRPQRASDFGIFIEYVNAAGEPSARRVSCRRIDLGLNTFSGHCHERGTSRTFRIDRVETAFDVETGEQIDIVELLHTLRENGLPCQDARLQRISTILMFLSRCDDGVHHLEVEAMERAATSFALRFDGDDAVVEDCIRMSARLTPDGDDFVRALRWVGRHEQRQSLARFITDQARQMVDADGMLHDQEMLFGVEVDKALRKLRGD